MKAIYVVEIGFVPNSSESRAKKQLRHAIIPNGGIQISTHVIICFFCSNLKRMLLLVKCIR